MSQPQPHPGDYGEPPDGDYARYVERLLQARAHHAPLPAALAAEVGTGSVLTRPAVVAAGKPGRQRVAPSAARRPFPLRWLLLPLWLLFALLMWFAPALLPLAMAAAVAGGIGYSLWKSKRGADTDGR